MKKLLLITISLLLIVAMCSCGNTSGDEEKKIGNDLFSADMLCVKYDGKYGYVDMEGEFLIDPIYEFATPFNGDVALVSDGDRAYVIDKEGNVLETYEEGDEYTPFYSELIYRILGGGKMDFVNDIYVYQNAGGKYGYRDAEDNIIVKAQFDYAYPFQEGVRLAKVKVDDKYGLVNEAGELVVEPEYESVELFYDGFAIITGERGSAFVDAEGNILHGRWFDKITRFSNGLSCAERDGQWGYLDTEGKWAIQPQFDGASSFSADGAAIVEVDGKYGFIDKEGKYIVSPRYEEARDFSEGYAAVKMNGEWEFINVAGESISYMSFDSVGDFTNGAAWVEIDGSYGFIKGDGDYVIRPQFSEVGDFAKNGLAAVLVDNKYGYINLSGEGVIQLVYDAEVGFLTGVKLPEESHFYDDGYAVGYKDGKYGVIDAEGVYVIGPRFEGIVTWDNLFTGLLGW